MLRLGLPGLRADSPLGQALASALDGIADIRPMSAEGCGPAPWPVRGTTLDWSVRSKHAPACPQDAPDLILDLHGRTSTGAPPTWRIVDAFGQPLLRRFTCLANPPGSRLVTSLYLVEAAPMSGHTSALAEAHISSQRTYRALLDAVGRAAAWLVRTGLQANASPPPMRNRVVFQARSHGVADGVVTRLAALRATLRDHLCSEIWAIGRIARPAEEFLTSRSVLPDEWIEVPLRDGFVADPMPWPGREGALLYERYSHRTGLGSIEALGPRRGPAETMDFGIRRHLSYPFTFMEDNTVYCLPEMSGERRQAMYELKPEQPPRVFCNVVDNVAVADPTLFRHAGLYWIAYNDADLGLHENLCLLYASRLEGPWTPHPRNPVKVDVRSSRPAGAPFNSGETLYRPAQDCSESYGCALVLNRIIACTPESYVEEPVARLTPDTSGPYPAGLHTFSLTPDGILIDGKRVVFDLGIFSQRLRRLYRRFIARFAPR